jgi:DNA-binding MurR/RpiR family transcriptional regulator
MPRARTTTVVGRDESPVREAAAPLAPLGGTLARMRVHEPAFTAVERRIAGAIRADGRLLVGLPMEELADRIGVSQTSLIRFCRRLGYRGLRDFKLALAAEVRGEGDIEASSIDAGDGFAAIARKVTAAAQQALVDSLDVLDPSALERATAALLGAGRVQLFGVGGSAPIAQDAHYRFARLGLPVAVVTDAHLQPVLAANLETADVAFVVSHTGRSREPVQVLEEAKISGATTILLTSFANTPAARWADVVLLTAPMATAPWGGMAPLRVAQLSVIDMLCVAIAARDSDRQDVRARYDATLERQMLPGGTGSGRPTAGSSADSDASIVTVDGGLPPVPSPANVAGASAPGPAFEQRSYVIDGVENVRHLGGFPVTGEGPTAPTVIRSGMLWQLTPAGIEQLRRLDVTAVVDLRYDDECRRYPTPSLEHAGIATVRAPMYEVPPSVQPDLDDRAGWIAVYRGWVEQSQSAMRTLVDTIAGTDGSVIMYCHLGEDRTGIAAALLLDLVGVDEAEILADYAMSPNGRGFEFLLSAMLERVRERWGSSAAYFGDAGVDEDTLERVRARMSGR